MVLKPLEKQHPFFAEMLSAMFAESFLSVFDADSYKVNMYQQYPPGTSYVYSYISARADTDKPMVFFGLQRILKQLSKITTQDVLNADMAWSTLDKSFNKEAWLRLVEKHDGKLPISIKAVREGTKLATKNVVAVVFNTDPEFYWLTTWVETLLQRLWYTCTIATRSYAIREDIKAALEESGDVSGLDFKLHEMGSRATSCPLQSAIAAMSHLTVFNGTDTLLGRLLATYEYNAPSDAAGTIPAMEHSTVTSWGRSREQDAYMNMYDRHLRNNPEGMCSIVMDSYDILNAIKGYAESTKDVINAGGITVIRIDSGEPEELLEPIMRTAAENFSFHVNAKGYKVFDKIRFIWSDGVTEESIRWILKHLMEWGWSADNFAFGVGGYLVQKVNRDTLSFAMKCSAVVVEDELVLVQKDPTTAAYKKSLTGLFALRETPDGYVTEEGSWADAGALEQVYLNGEILREQTFDEIRALIRS